MSKLLILFIILYMSVYCFISMVGHRGRSSRDSSPPCGNIITMAASSSPVSSRGQSQRTRSSTLSTTNSNNNTTTTTTTTTSSNMNLQQKYDSLKRLLKRKDDEVFQLNEEKRKLKEENEKLKSEAVANAKQKKKLKERLYEGHTGKKSPAAQKRANIRKREKKKRNEKDYKQLLSRVTGGEIAICSLQNATSPTSP